MDAGDRIFELLKLRKLTAKELSLKTGISQGNITDWKKKRSKPSLGALVKISAALNVSQAWLIHGKGEIEQPNVNKALSEESTTLIHRFNQLDELEKKLVMERVQSFIALKNERAKERVTADPTMTPITMVPMQNKKKYLSEDFIHLPFAEELAAAGSDNFMYDSTVASISIPKERVPEGTDFAIKITGDSMDDGTAEGIPAGSLLFVSEQMHIGSGQLGLFRINGDELVFKELRVTYENKGDDTNRITELISYNEAYEPRVIGEFDELRILGRVIGWEVGAWAVS